MPIHTFKQNQDLEDRGKVELVLVGLRYVGNKSTLPVGKFQRQGGWPGTSPLQGGAIQDDGSREPGPVQLALVPDWVDEDVENRTIIALENDPDVDVIYDRSQIAKSLLEKNYLPPRVFDRGYDTDLRARVFDELGLQDVGRRNVPGYREQLAEIAGEGAEALVSDQTRDAGRVGEYKTEYRRETLFEAANALGAGFDESVSRTELAEWLADQDTGDAERALDDPSSISPEDDEKDSDEPPDLEPETKHSIISAPGRFTVSEIEDELETGQWDDHLDSLEANERDGKDRKTVYDAIEAARGDD